LDGSSLTLVMIESSSIYSIPAQIFTKFPNLRWLYASGNKIHEIKPDTFANGKHLEYIDLNQNELSVLHPDTFKGECLTV
jgi:Leucine-rich repeat (LRR) protein